MKLLWLSVLSVVVFSGCAVSSHVMTGQSRAAISPESVKVYSSMPTNAVEIAILNGSDAWVQKTDRAVSSLKRDAARLGANGVVIENSKVNGWTGAEISAKAIFVP